MINVDRVYQTVNALLNKKEGDWLTPQEFNLFATTVQRQIFEDYFYSLGRAEKQYGEMDTMYGNIPDNIMEKLEDFETTVPSLTIAASGDATLPTDLYRLETITASSIPVEKKMHKEIGLMLRSVLISPDINTPVYTRNGQILTFYPNTTGDGITLVDVVVNYIKEPNNVVWASSAANGRVVYDAATSTDFELHASELEELIVLILEKAGVTLTRPEVVQYAQNNQTEITNSEQ